MNIWKKLRIFVISLVIVFAANVITFAATLNDGIIAYNQGNYVKAESYLRNALANQPSNVNIRYYLAISLVKNRKYEEAKYHYKYIINSAPTSNAAYWARYGLNMLETPYNTNSAFNKPEISRVVLSIEDHSSAIIINNVKVNNTPAGKFVFDTGATYTSISWAMARKLGINTSNAPKISLRTVNGVINAPKVKVDSIEINGLAAKNVEVTVNDISPDGEITGLLGLSFLKNFKVTIDRTDKTVTLEKKR